MRDNVIGVLDCVQLHQRLILALQMENVSIGARSREIIPGHKDYPIFEREFNQSSEKRTLAWPWGDVSFLSPHFLLSLSLLTVTLR